MSRVALGFPARKTPVLLARLRLRATLPHQAGCLPEHTHDISASSSDRGIVGRVIAYDRCLWETGDTFLDKR